jgi:hypothetical protein
MNYIKDINSFISEAISMKMYKENLPKKYWEKKPTAYKKWDKLFGKGVNRISIPLKSSQITLPETTPLMEEINSIFIPLGYRINSFEDYLNNKVYKIGDTKNPMKIGGLLSKSNPSLFKKFDTSLERKDWKDKLENSNKDLKIIISRHPYDILGMSSGREWRGDSCMRIGTKDDRVYKDIICSLTTKYNDVSTNKYDGDYGWVESRGHHKDKIKYDIEHGTLVAYVVKSDDNNINKPISRLLIKPYVNEKNSKDVIWVSSDSIYGEGVDGFQESVDNWIESWQGENSNGFYEIKKNLYADGKTTVKINKPLDKWTGKDKAHFLDEVCLGDWVINEKGEVDVDGSVNIRKSNSFFEKIPLKFGNVKYNFSCDRVGLTTLENCPNSVGGGFYCNDNYFTSLEYLPQFIGRGIYLQGNELISLKGLPENVNGTLNCSNNKLTDLNGSPKRVEGSAYFGNNKLTTLKWFPEYVGENISIENNNLRSIDVDLSQMEVTSFRCSDNQLTSLVGVPKKVQYNFECYDNQLTNLEGCPSEVGNQFNCSANFLTDLTGLPEILTDLFVQQNYLDGKTKGFPKIVKWRLFIGNQKSDYVFTEEEIRKVCDVQGFISE